MPASAATARRNFSGFPGLAVRGDGAAVREAVERAHGRAHQPVARRIVEAGDQPEAAAVALVGVLVESQSPGVHGAGLDVSLKYGRPAQTVRPRLVRAMTAKQALKEIRETQEARE
jgi:hypothetical protein